MSLFSIQGLMDELGTLGPLLSKDSTEPTHEDGSTLPSVSTPSSLTSSSVISTTSSSIFSVFPTSSSTLSSLTTTLVSEKTDLTSLAVTSSSFDSEVTTLRMGLLEVATVRPTSQLVGPVTVSEGIPFSSEFLATENTTVSVLSDTGLKQTESPLKGNNENVLLSGSEKIMSDAPTGEIGDKILPTNTGPLLVTQLQNVNLSTSTESEQEHSQSTTVLLHQDGHHLQGTEQSTELQVNDAQMDLLLAFKPAESNEPTNFTGIPSIKPTNEHAFETKMGTQTDRQIILQNKEVISSEQTSVSMEVASTEFNLERTDNSSASLGVFTDVVPTIDPISLISTDSTFNQAESVEGVMNIFASTEQTADTMTSKSISSVDIITSSDGSEEVFTTTAPGLSLTEEGFTVSGPEGTKSTAFPETFLTTSTVMENEIAGTTFTTPITDGGIFSKGIPTATEQVGESRTETSTENISGGILTEIPVSEQNFDSTAASSTEPTTVRSSTSTQELFTFSGDATNNTGENVNSTESLTAKIGPEEIHRFPTDSINSGLASSDPTHISTKPHLLGVTTQDEETTTVKAKIQDTESPGEFIVNSKSPQISTDEPISIPLTNMPEDIDSTLKPIDKDLGNDIFLLVDIKAGKIKSTKDPVDSNPTSNISNHTELKIQEGVKVTTEREEVDQTDFTKPMLTTPLSNEVEDHTLSTIIPFGCSGCDKDVPDKSDVVIDSDGVLLAINRNLLDKFDKNDSLILVQPQDLDSLLQDQDNETLIVIQDIFIDKDGNFNVSLADSGHSNSQFTDEETVNLLGTLQTDVIDAIKEAIKTTSKSPLLSSNTPDHTANETLLSDGSVSSSRDKSGIFEWTIIKPNCTNDSKVVTQTSEDGAPDGIKHVDDNFKSSTMKLGSMPDDETVENSIQTTNLNNNDQDLTSVPGDQQTMPAVTDKLQEDKVLSEVTTVTLLQTGETVTQNLVDQTNELSNEIPPVETTSTAPGEREVIHSIEASKSKPTVPETEVTIIPASLDNSIIKTSTETNKVNTSNITLSTESSESLATSSKDELGSTELTGEKNRDQTNIAESSTASAGNGQETVFAVMTNNPDKTFENNGFEASTIHPEVSTLSTVTPLFDNTEISFQNATTVIPSNITNQKEESAKDGISTLRDISLAINSENSTTRTTMSGSTRALEDTTSRQFVPFELSTIQGEFLATTRTAAEFSTTTEVIESEKGQSNSTLAIHQSQETSTQTLPGVLSKENSENAVHMKQVTTTANEDGLSLLETTSTHPQFGVTEETDSGKHTLKFIKMISTYCKK